MRGFILKLKRALRKVRVFMSTLKMALKGFRGLSGHPTDTGWVTALAVTERQGRTVIVSGSGTVGQPLQCHSLAGITNAYQIEAEIGRPNKHGTYKVTKSRARHGFGQTGSDIKSAFNKGSYDRIGIVTIPGIEITTNNINRIHILGGWGFVLQGRDLTDTFHQRTSTFVCTAPALSTSCWGPLAKHSRFGIER
jgi:hypothetical protein